MKKLLLSLILTQFIVFSGHSQITKEKSTAYIKEFFGDKYNVFVNEQPQRIASYLNLLTERIEFKKISNSKGEKYIKISELELFNKFNPNIRRDSSYDISTFNPLKYSMQFFNLKTNIYRLEGTEWVIIVKAQNIK